MFEVYTESNEYFGQCKIYEENNKYYMNFVGRHVFEIDKKVYGYLTWVYDSEFISCELTDPIIHDGNSFKKFVVIRGKEVYDNA